MLSSKTSSERKSLIIIKRGMIEAKEDDDETPRPKKLLYLKSIAKVRVFSSEKRGISRLFSDSTKRDEEKEEGVDQMLLSKGKKWDLKTEAPPEKQSCRRAKRGRKN